MFSHCNPSARDYSEILRPIAEIMGEPIPTLLEELDLSRVREAASFLACSCCVFCDCKKIVECCRLEEPEETELLLVWLLNGTNIGISI